jgi:protein gp37
VEAPEAHFREQHVGFVPRVRSDDFIAEVFAVMARAHWHTFQLLTKRHGRMRSLLSRPSFRDNLAHWASWPLPNVWLGVSAEDQQWWDIRVPALLETPAAVRFVSMHPAWVRFLRDQCEGARVPYFFKQRGQWTWDRESGQPEPRVYVCAADGSVAGEQAALADGGSWAGVWRVGKGRAGRLLDGRTWDEFPRPAQAGVLVS